MARDGGEGDWKDEGACGFVERKGGKKEIGKKRVYGMERKLWCWKEREGESKTESKDGRKERRKTIKKYIGRCGGLEEGRGKRLKMEK